MQIIRQWRLAVLRVELDLTEREPAVVATFLSHPSARRQQQWTRRDPLHAYSRNGSADDAQVPAEVVRGVGDVLADEGDPMTALWLRITPPSGFLGAVPWERSLGTLGRPVLRVPDRLPVAALPRSRWTIAAAVSADRGARWGAEHVRNLADALAAFPVPVTLHVFADAGTHAQLARTFGTGAVTVVVHDPGTVRDARRKVARTRRTDLSHASRTPAQTWAAWVVSGLDGQAADVLHLASTASADVDIPLLTMAADPAVPSDRSSCGFASEDQMQLLADAVGAPTLAFVSPPRNPSDVATRLLADTAGGRRPGPTVYCDLDGEGIGPAERPLVEAYALLARPDPARSALPTDPRLFAYLQPADIQSLLADPLRDHVQDLGPDVGYESAPPVLADLATGTTPATEPADGADQWMASSARFVDSQVANLLATSPGDTPEPLSSSYDAGAAEAVRDLNALLSKYGDGS